LGKNCCHGDRTKERSDSERRALINRLKRIEGQIRGITRMIEADAYCVDILTQVTAVEAALGGFARAMLSEHIMTCVVKDIKEGNLETAEELAATVERMLR